MEKPRLIDRLITICLYLDLFIAFWLIFVSYNYQNQILSGVS
jgi:hypothetical protein